jgi:hypothetical protein
MHKDEDNAKDEFSILKQVFGVAPAPQESASEVRLGRAEDFLYEGLMTIPGRFKPGIDKMPGIYPHPVEWFPLYAAEDMARGILLNRVVELTEDGSAGLAYPCRSGSDLPFAVLTCDRRAGERIHREDIAHSSGLTKSAPSD